MTTCRVLAALPLIVWLCVLGACQSQGEPDGLTSTSRFQGDPSATRMAEEMFEAIGGKHRWAALRSLYIKARHTEPEMDQPYESEIWRGIDEFRLRIVQRNDSFHRLARVNADGGRVVYVDEGGRSRTFTPEQLNQWTFEHNHNVYVVLHRLGKNPNLFRVTLEETDRLTFYDGDQLLAAFRLDEASRPHLFYQPTLAGDLSASEFSKWGTHDGLVHSAGGGPLDGNFRYTTLEWQPSTRSFSESYSFEEDAD